MNSCELVSLSTFIACNIAKCAPKEDLPLITALLNQIASSIGVIIVSEDIKENKPVVPEVIPESEVVTLNPFPLE